MIHALFISEKKCNKKQNISQYIEIYRKFTKIFGKYNMKKKLLIKYKR